MFCYYLHAYTTYTASGFYMVQNQYLFLQSLGFLYACMYISGLSIITHVK